MSQTIYALLSANKTDLETKIRSLKLAGEKVPKAYRDAHKEVVAALATLESDSAPATEEGAPETAESEVSQSESEGSVSIVSEEEAVDDMPDEIEDEFENPVSMPAKMRREMGDHSADFMDEYALTIHQKVLKFFTDLERILDIGSENTPDNKLRSLITSEVGNRGLWKIEPVFPEWRAAIVKSISKDVALLFEPPTPPGEEEAESVGEMENTDTAGMDEPEDKIPPIIMPGVSASADDEERFEMPVVAADITVAVQTASAPVLAHTDTPARGVFSQPTAPSTPVAAVFAIEGARADPNAGLIEQLLSMGAIENDAPAAPAPVIQEKKKAQRKPLPFTEAPEPVAASTAPALAVATAPLTFSGFIPAGRKPVTLK